MTKVIRLHVTTTILWLMIRIRVRMMNVIMGIRLHVATMNLSRPVPLFIIEGPQLIVEVKLHRIKHILYMKDPLQMLPLMNQTPLHLIHAFIALSSSMTNQATPSA